MGFSEHKIRQAVERYEREYDRYAKLAACVADICRAEIVEANAIRAQVAGLPRVAWIAKRYLGFLDSMISRGQSDA